MNMANKITIFRILLTPFFIALVLYSKWEFALVVFVIAAISDGVDGYIARHWSERTEIGKVLDPVADKLLILSAFIVLSVNRHLLLPLKFPLYVPVIIISRDGIIILGAILNNIIKGRLAIKPTVLSKITTFLQMVTVPSVLLRLSVSPILWNIAVLFTVISGVDYVIKGSVFLNEKE